MLGIVFKVQLKLHIQEILKIWLIFEFLGIKVGHISRKSHRKKSTACPQLTLLQQQPKFLLFPGE